MTTVVDFPDRYAIAEEAAEWLIKLDADTPPGREELRALGEWLHRSPAHRDQLENLATLWGRLNVLTELAVPLAHPRRVTTRGRFVKSAASLWKFGIAPKSLLVASLVIVIALGVALFARRGSEPLLSRNGLYATAVGQQQSVVLADGSQVTLNTDTQIQVVYSGGYRRVHLLQGEALFTVAKQAARPFRVYAGNGRIEALGTAFSVYLNGAEVDVAVTEGRVSLAAAQPFGSAVRQLAPQAPDRRAKAGSTPDLDDDRMQSLGIIAAGHLATIHDVGANAASGASALQGVRTVAPQELARRLAWREGIMVFSGETLQDVVNEFARYTTVSIEIPDAAVRQMRIGGRFPLGETQAMFAVLETNFNLRVTRLGHNRVVISAADK